MQHPAGMLILVGLLTTIVGVVWLFAPHLPWLGRLPGDVAIEREQFRFYFPLTTCLLISLLLTGLLWLVRKFFP
jgi:H+/Cl- antiporter ClcA